MEQKSLKQVIKTVKRLMKNKRYRGLVFLLGYAILFVFIASILNQPTTNTNNNQFDLNNYSYQINININDDPNLSKTIVGKRYLNKELITYENQSYYFVDNVLVGFPLTTIDITKLRFDYLSEYLNVASIINNDNGTTTYSVPLNEYIKINNGVNITSDKSIIIMITMLNNEIQKVTLDLTNYVNYSAMNYNKYEVTISYSEFNQISDFNNQ